MKRKEVLETAIQTVCSDRQDRQLYKQAGNSGTVNVIYEIAKHFRKDEL